MNAFNLIIIGDEILHGSRQDKHFAFFKSLLESKGLKLNQVQYLPDEPDLLVRQLRRSFSDGIPTFVTGGIGATPDDHTRQAAAAALDLPVVRHSEAAKFIEGITQKRGEPLDSPEHAQRLKMADFPEGAELVPNPFNNIAGFSIREHYFFPSSKLIPACVRTACPASVGRIQTARRSNRTLSSASKPKEKPSTFWTRRGRKCCTAWTDWEQS